MLNKYGRERVRRAYNLEKKSIYQTAKEDGCCHQAIERANFDSLHYRCDPLKGVLSCQHQLSEAIPAPQPQSSERLDLGTWRFFPAMNSC
jgi:hypothetical protein